MRFQHIQKWRQDVVTIYFLSLHSSNEHFSKMATIYIKFEVVITPTVNNAYFEKAALLHQITVIYCLLNTTCRNSEYKKILNARVSPLWKRFLLKCVKITSVIDVY